MADVADNDLLDYEEEDQVRKFTRSNWEPMYPTSAADLF